MRAAGLSPCIVALVAALFSTADSVDLCLAPSTHSDAKGSNVSVGCLAQQLNDNIWRGFSTEGDPCENGEVCLWLPARDIHDFGWTISASDEDPYANEGPLEIDALFLWFACSSKDWTGDAGLQAAAFDLTGSIEVSDLILRNGFLNAGTTTSPLLVVGGCPTTEVLAAEIRIVEPTPVETQSWGVVKSRYGQGP